MSVRSTLRRLAIFSIATTHLFTLGMAQNMPQQPPGSCPRPDAVDATHLIGTWWGRIDGLPGVAVLQLRPHPEHRDGVSGRVRRAAGGGPQDAAVSGDVDEGRFTLEESEDGQRIAATWSGTVMEDSCGKTINGHWWRDNPDQPQPFTLRKQSGWD